MFLDVSVRKKYPEFTIDATMQAKKGEFISILGPSGSGKTTLLHLISGLEMPDYGRIALDGEDITGYLPEKREFGMVFQEKLLFPHLSVLENVRFGLRMHGLDLDAANSMLKEVGLARFSHRKIQQLSGGEMQRVAIARSLAYNPKLLLLDEPLKELDAVVADRILRLLRKLQKSRNITTLYVTHDVEEAFSISDRIYLMHEGRMVQNGPPLAVFENPENKFVRKYFSPYRALAFGGKRFIGRAAMIAQKKRN